MLVTLLLASDVDAAKLLLRMSSVLLAESARKVAGAIAVKVPPRPDNSGAVSRL